MPTLELIYSYFEEPKDAILWIKEKKPVEMGLLGFFIYGLSFFAARTILSASGTFPNPVFGFLAIGAVLLCGFFLVAVLHLILEMAGHRGDAASLFVLYGMADLVFALAVPLALISRVFRVSSAVMSAEFFLLGFWSLSLKARALRENYGLTATKSWYFLMLPYLILFGLFLVGVTLVVIGVIWQISGFFS